MRFSRRHILALILGSLPLGAAESDLAVVVRPDTPVDSLTLGELRKLLLGERQFWTSGLRVTLLIRAPEAFEREVVLRSIYRMSEAQFRQYWISKVFRAEAASGPRLVYTNAVAVELVRSVPGAIAFLGSGQSPKDLKVLKIDGKLPGEKNYPLR